VRPRRAPRWRAFGTASTPSSKRPILSLSSSVDIAVLSTEELTHHLTNARCCASRQTTKGGTVQALTIINYKSSSATPGVSAAFCGIPAAGGCDRWSAQFGRHTTCTASTEIGQLQHTAIHTARPWMVAGSCAHPVDQAGNVINFLIGSMTRAR